MGRILKVIIGGDASGAKDAADETAQAYGKLGSKLADFGKSASAVFAGTALLDGAKALGGKLSDAFAEALDIEEGRDKLAAQLGLTAQQSEAYGKAAGELYSAAYGESLNDVNDALRFVTQNIGDQMGNSETALKDAAAAALDLSSAFGTDLSETTRAVGVLLKNGLAKDATEAFDILTVGFQNGANAGDDLTDTISEYSPLFARLGLSGQQAMGMISQSMKAGARDSDFAADAIKEFSIRAIDGSKLTVESFQALGLNADKMRATFAKGGPEAAAAMDLVLDKLRGTVDPAKRAEIAVGLFGTKAEDLGDTLLAMDPSAAVSTFGQVEGAAARMGATLADNAGTRIETFKRTLQTALVDFIGGQVIPKFMELTDKVAPALETLRGKIADGLGWLTDPANQEALRAVQAVIGVLLVAAFAQLAVSAGAAAVSVLAATWPILAIAAAVGGLVFAFMKAYENLEWFRTGVENVKAAAVAFWQNTLVPMVDWLRDRWVGDVWPKVLAVVDAVRAAWPSIEAAMQSFYENALKPVFSFIASNADMVKNLGIALAVVAGIIAGAVIAAIVVGAGMLAVLVAAFGAVMLAVVTLGILFQRFVQIVWDVFNNVRDSMGGVIDWFENVIQVGWDLAQNVAMAIGSAAGVVGGFVGAAWSMAWGVAEALDGAVRWFQGLPGRIIGAVGDLGSVLWNAGASLIGGLIRGITDKFGEVQRTLARLTEMLPDWKGPAETDATILRPSGQLVMGGFAEGLADGERMVRDRLRRLTGSLPAAAAPAASSPAPALGGAGGAPQTVTVQVMLDRRVLAETVADVTRQREGALR